MARGFISGAVWGAVVGVLGLVVVSQIVMPPPRGAAPTAAPQAAAPEATPAPEPEKTTPPAADAEPAMAEPAPPSAAPAGAATTVTPTPAEPQATTAAPAAEPAAEPTPPATAQPQTIAPATDATAEPPAPATITGPEAPAPAVEPAAEAAPPASAEPQAAAPATGAVAERPAQAAATTEPASEATVAETPAPPTPAPEPKPADPAPSDTPPTPVATPDTLETPAAGTADAGLPQPDAAPVAPLAEALPEASDAEATPAKADMPPPPPLTAEEEALLVPTPITPANPTPALIAPETPEPAKPAEVTEPLVLLPDTETPGTLTPDTAPAGEVAGVRSDRLPRIGVAPAAEPAPQTPLALFARPFENPAQKPLFAILLVDTGGPNVDRTSLANLPFPVSFVIDPAAPDAQTAAQIYRAAGQEVLMLATGIPKGATASDLEQTFQSNATALPEAVAVVDLPEGGFQEDRPLASLVVPLVAAQGRGLITYDKGLNAGDQVARREDLPAATIFRRLDAEGESTPVIRRYLDRAAFKAAQEGRVVVQGTTRPETVQALLEWTVEGRAGSVELAPASAVLQVK